jgi:hypothetical protein
LLRQACAHCGKFLAAASRRSRGRVSVPVWLAVLSDQLPITALVGRYPTNQLIGRRPLPRRPKAFITEPTVQRPHEVLPRVSTGYPPPRGRLPTCSSPVRHVSRPKTTPFDLHALGTPPALILSQDQTLHQSASSSHPVRRWSCVLCLGAHLIQTPPPPADAARFPGAPTVRRSIHPHDASLGIAFLLAPSSTPSRRHPPRLGTHSLQIVRALNSRQLG